MKIKSISKKLIICLMVFLLLFNFGFASVSKVNLVYADTERTDDEIAAEAEEEATASIGGILNGVAGFITIPFRALLLIISSLLQTLSYFVINTAGHGTNEVSTLITPYDVFFNKFTLTDVNIFSVDDLPNTSGGNVVYNIREFSAMLYYVVRAICIGILLIMLLIIGIKTALASLAEEKAKVKKMFFDWVVSAGLVILMHMIIIFIITANNAIIDIISNIAQSANVENAISSLSSAALSSNFLLGWGATFAYAMISVQTFAFVVIYIFRLLKVIFLIIFSPVVALFYSIDKAKSGQALALNKWLKEFTANVFIQVVHCIIYVVLVAVPMSALESVTVSSISSLTLPLILIFAILFVKKAEELMKSLFGFDDSTTLTTYSSVVNNSQRAILTGISIKNGTYTVTNNVSNNSNKVTFGSNIQTLGQKASAQLHKYRDQASQWLTGQESKLTPVNAEYAQLDDDSKRNATSDADSDNVEYADSNNTEDADSNNIENVDGTSTESQDENLQQDVAVVPVVELPEGIDDSIANKIAEAIRLTQGSQTIGTNEQTEKIETENVETQEEIDINAENLEEFFKDEKFFSSVRYDRGNRVSNYLDAKEKAEFIRNLEDILDKYKNGQAELEDVIKCFEEHGLEYNDKILEDLFNKFGLKMKEAPEDKEITPTELTTENIEKFIEKNNIISDRRDETNYRPPEVKKEFVTDLMDDLQKYKNGEIGIDDLKKRFASYGLQADEKMINNLINEFVPEKTEETIVEETVENSEEKRPNLEVIESTVEKDTVIQKDVVNIGSIQLLKGDLNKVILSTRGKSVRNSKLLEILEADITARGDYSREGLIKFNTRIIEKSGKGAFSQSNLQAAEEAVRREGDIALRRLENFRREQTEANARMLTPAGRELAVLEIQAQQAGLFVSEASVQTASSMTVSRESDLLTSSQTVGMFGTPVDNMSPTGQSENVIDALNNDKKKYA